MALKVVKNAKRRESYSLISQGKTLMNSPFKNVVEQSVGLFFGDLRSVSMKANHQQGKTVAHFIYGRKQ